MKHPSITGRAAVTTGSRRDLATAAISITSAGWCRVALRQRTNASTSDHFGIPLVALPLLAAALTDAARQAAPLIAAAKSATPDANRRARAAARRTHAGPTSGRTRALTIQLEP